jgi:hypothetical protein
MNVIIFIIRVLKLLFMHEKYFFLAFAVIIVLASPVAGSLTKISAGAPVYVGEQNLDISAGLQGCRVIEWWEEGADTSGPASKNITVIRTLEDSDIAFKYTIRPEVFSGYTGTWYCEGKRPLRPVFVVLMPELAIRFWDLDNDVDVTGTTVPLTANITYRIDTNLDKALQQRYRPDMTSLDSFYTISLTDPGNKVLSSIYTGNYGKADTRVLIFEKKPIISASPYYWKDGSVWDRTSRNIQGESIYAPGTYAITIGQNLNHMQELYRDITSDTMTGILNASATITFVRPEPTPVPSVSATAEPSTGTIPSSPASTSSAAPTGTTLPTRTTVPAKTTYAPLPLWVVLTALGTASAYAVRQIK